jgi:hypothetical protein
MQDRWRHRFLDDSDNRCLLGYWGFLLHLPFDPSPQMLSELWWENNPVILDINDGSDLALEHLSGDVTWKGMIYCGKVIEDETESALKLL